MWSLPDIERMNAEAVKNARILARAAKRIKPKCDHDEEDCEGEVRSTIWYDVYSDNPKGTFRLCEKHYGYLGDPKGYFYCKGCNRTYIESYTWEMYYHDSEDGRECLNCYAKKVLVEDSSWMMLDNNAIQNLRFEYVRQAPHIFAEGGPRYELKDYGRTIFYSKSYETGAYEIREALRKAWEAGNHRAILVMFGGGQLAVSISVYAEK